MAGNLVKWWRQFKQYKQFSVLQECATDSEELIYQTPTSCIASSDILMNNHQKSSKAQTQHSAPQQQQSTVAIAPSHSSEAATTTTTIASSQPQMQPTVQQKSVKAVKVKEQQMKEKMSQEQLERLQKRHSIATTRHLEKIEENRMQLDEVTCDISAVPDPSKKPQPIQFSFTLYDVDGHGKITKDDIAGIVSTIYDSLGKSVVVPHYGKKTINVKLTVSPDAKQQQQKALQSHEHQIRANKKHQSTQRRRYRPRALLSDDDDEERSESNSDNLAPLPNMTQPEIIHNSTKTCENNLNNQNNNNNNNNNVYESINNLKLCNQTCTLDNLMTAKNNKNIEIFKNCQPSHSPERLHIDENLLMTKPQAKKKLLKKTRSRRSRTLETRGRSLSVGNEQKWRKPEKIPVDLVNDSNLNNSTSIRRDELIEIIKDSMEKNRLCFQGNRKSENINSSNQMRQRSNTVTCTNKMSVSNNTANNCGDFDQQHLCAFDSFLHATICSNLQHSTTVSDPTKVNKINNRHKMKQMNQSMPPALKLKSSVLNQLNPNLTPEQKLSRKLNDVEKWLLDDKNIHNPNAVDKLSTNVTSTPKKVFNKEVLLSKKSKSHSKQQKDVINASKNQIILEYLSDCENLLLSDDDQTTKAQPTNPASDNKANEINPESGSVDSTSKSSVRFVHIHHHFYHFNQNECN